MAPMFRDNRSIVSGLGFITVAVVITVIAFALLLNNRCVNTFLNDRMLYPNATLVEEEAHFLGIQRMVYHSPDTPEMVNDWYNRQNTNSMRDAVTSGNFSNVRQLIVPVQVAANDENGGSTLTFAVVCPTGAPLTY
mgnify:CR=1 FL=1